MKTTDTVVKQKDKLIDEQYKLVESGTISFFGKLALLFKIQVSKIIKTPMLLFGMFGLPLILLFGIGALIQDGAMFTPAFGILGIVVSGVIFGDLYFTIEHTTLEKSTSTSNYGHKTKLLAISIVTFCATFLAIFVELLVFCLFEAMDWFFMPSFVFFGPEHYQSLTIELSTLQWGNVIYYISMNILLSLGMYIFLKNFFRTNKTFTMFLLSYVLLDLVFGGVLVMNYNVAQVTMVDGKLQSTGYLVNDAVELGTADSPWVWTSWYQYTKFFVPHYFLNQQFATLLKQGSHQQMEAEYFINNTFFVDWSLGTQDGFEWMVSAQEDIYKNAQLASGVGESDLISWTYMDQIPEGQTLYSVMLSSGADIEASALQDSIINAYYATNRSMPVDVSYWKAYNNDYTFILTVILPFVYTVALTWVGFTLSRI